MAVPPGLLTSESCRPESSKVAAKSFADLFRAQSSPAAAEPPLLRKASEYCGKPAFWFTSDEFRSFAAPRKLSLVGKFSHGRPTMDLIKKSMTEAGLNGTVQIGHIDKKHVLLTFSSEEDYLRIWSKGVWRTEGFPMRLLKWTPFFFPDAEPSVVLVWIRFDLLPCHLFRKDVLFSLAGAVGHPLRVDEATQTQSRPGSARVLVEIDLMKTLPDRVWIGLSDDEFGFWQPIVYENLPSYCISCAHVGHISEKCKRSSSIEDRPLSRLIKHKNQPIRGPIPQESEKDHQKIKPTSNDRNPGLEGQKKLKKVYVPKQAKHDTITLSVSAGLKDHTPTVVITPNEITTLVQPPSTDDVSERITVEVPEDNADAILSPVRQEEDPNPALQIQRSHSAPLICENDPEILPTATVGADDMILFSQGHTTSESLDEISQDMEEVTGTVVKRKGRPKNSKNIVVNIPKNMITRSDKAPEGSNSVFKC